MDQSPFFLSSTRSFGTGSVLVAGGQMAQPSQKAILRERRKQRSFSESLECLHISRLLSCNRLAGSSDRHLRRAFLRSHVDSSNRACDYLILFDTPTGDPDFEPSEHKSSLEKWRGSWVLPETLASLLPQRSGLI